MFALMQLNDMERENKTGQRFGVGFPSWLWGAPQLYIWETKCRIDETKRCKPSGELCGDYSNRFFKAFPLDPDFKWTKPKLFSAHLGQNLNVELSIVNLHAQRTNLANLSNGSWLWGVRQRSGSYLVS